MPANAFECRVLFAPRARAGRLISEGQRQYLSACECLVSLLGAILPLVREFFRAKALLCYTDCIHGMREIATICCLALIRTLR